VERKESLIETKNFEFALDIIVLYKELVKKNEYVISKQIQDIINIQVNIVKTTQERINII